MAEATKRYAVVTGANKGIGFETVRQLASNGFNVVLTARDEKRGREAVEKLKESTGLTGQVIFHQLDVANPASVASLADFIKIQFGKLDILVNNAGVGGRILDADAFYAALISMATGSVKENDWSKALAPATNESTEECMQINYYGAKTTAEALIPLLQLSDSPRIINVASSLGTFKYLPNEWARGVFSDIENLTEDRIDDVLTEMLKDFKEGSLESKNWPSNLSGYILSKAAMIAYTKILAKKYPHFRINALCPGYVKTDITCNTGLYPVEEGAACVVKLALLPKDGHTGLFFDRFEPYFD